MEAGRGDDAKTWADQSLAYADAANPLFRDLVRANYTVMAKRWQALAGRGEYALAESEIEQYRLACPVREVCPEHRLWLYSNWSQSLWEKEKWEDAVAKLKLAMRFAGDGAQKYREALDGAYSNWANTHFKAEQYAEARKVLERCLAESAKNKNCRESMERLRQAGL